MISCKAPCKVNVSLRVLGKRPDGFHEVDTVMVPLDLCDVLEFSPAACLEMSCDAPGVPLDESNLVMKAGRLMERELGRSMPWHVRLVKKVPHGAGLGGGSADCGRYTTSSGSVWRSWEGKSAPTWGFSFMARRAAAPGAERRWSPCRSGRDGVPGLFY